MMDLLPKTYNPNEVEDRIYKLWEEGGYFKPEINQGGEPYCIIMPPPNANGALHIGHAVFVTLEDLMIRYARMRGKATLWLPGADHAGFETQVVFEKKLEKEGRSRWGMARDDLYQEMWEFTQANKKIMEGQLKKLGASCDWDREKFTLDAEIIKIIYQTFKKLFEDGLLYRALRIANWCPKHKTSLSDLEVKYVEQEDALYYIKYGPLTVATVRPETKFGDTALAVNPKDKRYKEYVGKEIEAQGVLGVVKLKVVSDEVVDPEFGTGVVKVTPAHDQVDFEIWQRHKDEIPGPKIVIDESGRLNQETGRFAGMKVMEARQAVTEEMKKIGILEKIDEHYKHTVATCYKCGNAIEPLPREQWFVAVNKKGKSGKALAPDALETIKKGQVKFVTKKFEKIIIHWLKNIRDWNISRQIVWGIRIPAYYCGDAESRIMNQESREKPATNLAGCGETIVSEEKPEKCPKCGGTNLVQDTDVFDTWFSSGQWTFAPLLAQTNSQQETRNKKQNEEVCGLYGAASKEFEEFYPTAVMETGWDILFFWVARMIMLGLYATDEVPFKNVYLHGLVRDKDRQKMSKSKGNVIDPLGVASEYGTDAVRMALVFGTAAGNDIIISEDKIRGMRNFANKIWNISRFILINLENANLKSQISKSQFKIQNVNEATKQDKGILDELDKTVKEMTRLIEGYRFNQAGELIYDFIWHKLADVYLEESKSQISNPKIRENTLEILQYVLATSLKLLHPFMPYITEEIWGKLPGEKQPLIITGWPE